MICGDDMADTRPFGRKDGSQTGKNSGGRRKNQTDICRHPDKKAKR